MSKFDDKYAEIDVSEGKWIFWFSPPYILKLKISRTHLPSLTETETFWVKWVFRFVTLEISVESVYIL